MPQNVARVRITTPETLISASEALRNAWFRGEGSTKWKLQSSLERDAERFAVPVDDIWHRERRMLEAFKKRAHLFTRNNEYPESYFEWHALIRHYGGPSRLLDITSSCLVAAYFALVDSRPKEAAVIWAFQEGTIGASEDVDWNSHFQQNGPTKVVVGIPERFNVRLNAQNGAFFVPGCVKTSLESQIGITYETDFQLPPSVYKSAKKVAERIEHRIWKFVIPHENHAEIFRFLSRCNIRSYTIYPGTEGLAASLRELMRAHE
ncbi:MAG: FRG domain-containing protein [Thermodesulfobacteriota bacterium]